MAHPHVQAFTKAFSGLGIEESALIAIVGKSHPEHTRTLRKDNTHFFIEDERSFERWDDHRVKLLKHEFARFKNALVLWAMHPWERDARLIKEALRKGPESYSLIVEITCTRSSEELLGARKAYHSLFDHSIEEDVATHVSGHERKLLVALVSAYRYEGPKIKDDAAKSDTKLLVNAIKNGDKIRPIEDEEVVRILSTRSKPHLQAVFKHYKELSGKSVDEEINGGNAILRDTVQCLSTPHVYFSKVMDGAMRSDTHKRAKKGLTRVIVTRADVDLKEIVAVYNKLYGVSLAKKVEDTSNGNYRDFLIALISREN